MRDPNLSNGEVKGLLSDFAKEFQPLETTGQLLELTDSRTGARYCECHIKGSKLISLGTIDVPLDPEDQSDYRANREIVLNDAAFQTMKGMRSISGRLAISSQSTPRDLIPTTRLK